MKTFSEKEHNCYLQNKHFTAAETIHRSEGITQYLTDIGSICFGQHEDRVIFADGVLMKKLLFPWPVGNLPTGRKAWSIKAVAHI